ncbi:MAG: SDR family oxidoreductase [Lewinellaceae bacterium]|nr:SDR family oxidoreductase [Saprospiraceae bacterium]MCB9340746.1 SDR family oxidoreductase [Lewinellaceae bacterium]
MKVTIFGATGMVGQYLVDETIAQLHTARAFGRNVFEVFSTERTYLELSKGYLFSEDDIKKALKGADAVLSAIGGGFDGTDRARSIGMKKIVEAMEKKGPKRIVAIGGAGLLNADEGTFIYEMPGFPEKYKAVTLEHRQAYDHLSSSSLDWTFVCPPIILDAKATESYNTNRNYPAEGNQQITAGDLAHFMVKELIANEYLKCRVGIASV